MATVTVAPRVSDRIFGRQKTILVIAYWLIRPFGFLGRRKISWVVGTEEIALMVSHLAGAIPDSFSVVHRPHPFYATDYDLVIQRTSSRIEMYRRLYGGPLALAWLLNRTQGIIYVGSAGFLLDHVDNREFEFRFVRNRGRRLVCYFTGNDIRSPRLMRELEAEMGRPNLGTFLPDVDPVFATDEYDAVRRERARVADAYANTVFNAKIDQLSYLAKPTEPFRYFYPDEEFTLLADKFEGVDRPLVVHAPSSPALKGTNSVREAITRLQAEGYALEYRELTNVSNAEILSALTEAQIVLNEFYAFVPGVFGIEAMAKCCALLTSADERIETDLDAGANQAWVVTPVTEVYANLKRLLDDPAETRAQALRGFTWAREYASASRDGDRLRAVLDRVLSA